MTVQQTSGVRNLAAAGSLHTTQQSGSAISYDDQSGLTAADFAAFEWRYHQYQYRNGRTTAQVGDEPARAADWELILVSSFWDSNGTWQSANAVFRPPVDDNHLVDGHPPRYVDIDFDEGGRPLPAGSAAPAGAESGAEPAASRARAARRPSPGGPTPSTPTPLPPATPLSATDRGGRARR